MLEAANTHSEYVILISFPQQQRLHERVSILLYTYTASLLNLTPDRTNDNHIVSNKLMFLIFSYPICDVLSSYLSA